MRRTSDILTKNGVMKMIKFAICDDEPFTVKELSEHLSRYMEEKRLALYRIETFPDGSSLLDCGCSYDLIFLDIRMEHLNGMETARKLRQQNNNSLLIFVTVLEEYVFDAFEVQAFGYLLKPLNSELFRRTMDRSLEALRRQKNRDIVICKGNSCQVIPLSEIIYCEVQGRKVYLHQSGGEITDCYGKLEDFGQRFDNHFFRCHRSFIVNLGYVRGYATGQITLSQGSKIPVSRLREHDFTQALLCYMKERNL